MKLMMVSLLVAAGLVAGLVIGVVAQNVDDTSNSPIGQIRPLLANVYQQIPITLTLAVPIDSSIQTVTVPLQLDLGVTLGIANNGAVSVDMAAAEPAVVTVSEPTPTPVPTVRSDVAIVTDVAGNVYEVSKLRVLYTGSNSKYLEFSFQLETGQVIRTVQDKLKLDELLRLTYSEETLELYMMDGSTISLSPGAYTEKDVYGNLIESGTVIDLTLAMDDPQQSLVGFDGNVTTPLGMKSSFEIPLEGLSSIEFEDEPQIELKSTAETSEQ